MTLDQHLFVFVFGRRKLIRSLKGNLAVVIQASTEMCCTTPNQNINEFISHYYVEKVMILSYC